ncbi:RNA polymerase sigma factor [Fusicatenibacter saccharivorans]|uniref:RNA polymerase sigma factor n=1 Tax=Fusicatenibacter saccharivorans TaxID=1150298 RepID=UPI001FA76BB8|nr:sigma factor-like helix-turn-helix DNA-binding protein [Fusicatenibacter saccharivorans]
MRLLLAVLLVRWQVARFQTENRQGTQPQKTVGAKGIVRNYRKELKRRRNKEISYCELPEIVVEKLAVWDEYESDYTAFDVCGIEVRVLDDDLAEAIKYLSEKDREILLMYFFLGMSDTEIGDRLKINRSTSFRSRKNSLEEIKKKLKENMNDE